MFERNSIEEIIFNAILSQDPIEMKTVQMVLKDDLKAIKRIPCELGKSIKLGKSIAEDIQRKYGE